MESESEEDSRTWTILDVDSMDKKQEKTGIAGKKKREKMSGDDRVMETTWKGTGLLERMSDCTEENVSETNVKDVQWKDIDKCDAPKNAMFIRSLP